MKNFVFFLGHHMPPHPPGPNPGQHMIPQGAMQHGPPHMNGAPPGHHIPPHPGMQQHPQGPHPGMQMPPQGPPPMGYQHPMNPQGVSFDNFYIKIQKFCENIYCELLILSIIASVSRTIPNISSHNLRVQAVITSGVIISYFPPFA